MASASESALTVEAVADAFEVAAVGGATALEALEALGATLDAVTGLDEAATLAALGRLEAAGEAVVVVAVALDAGPAPPGAAALEPPSPSKATRAPLALARRLGLGIRVEGSRIDFGTRHSSCHPSNSQIVRESQGTTAPPSGNFPDVGQKSARGLLATPQVPRATGVDPFLLPQSPR